ncbi:MAG: M56 family metallopeptidase [Prolixibacteraceae bacterium]|jgi:bla regulator protein BlaR1|nr:M56 family metallopeptidase [Prolixibacteraceae bacterium]
MNTLQTIFSPELIEAIGWTIIHSLWQGAIVAIVLSILLIFLRKNSAQVKYIISFFSLLIMLSIAALTFVNTYTYAKEKAVLKENITTNPGYIKTYLEQNIANKTLTEEEIGEATINLKLVKVRSFFQRNFNIICSVWMLGMLFLIIRMLGGLLYTRRLRSYQIIELSEEWLSKIEAYSQKLGLKRKVNAFFSPLANGPITLGTFKPIILFPISAFTGLSSENIEAIIAHELAHVLRHDYFFNIIQSMVEILFFYHPAVWIISAQIRNERENSCDNIAIELTGDKVAYVKALAQVQINQVEQGQLAMAFATSKGNIL